MHIDFWSRLSDELIYWQAIECFDQVEAVNVDMGTMLGDSK